MMSTNHVSQQLAARIDGQLSASDSQLVDLHLRQCEPCRSEYDQVKLGIASMDLLPTIEAPASVWISIEAALNQGGSRRISTANRFRWALAAGLALAFASGVYWLYVHQLNPGAQWQVTRLAGSPVVDSKPIGPAGKIAAGQWIETDVRSRAAITVGQIGSMEIEPNTRVRLVTATPGEHRVSLAHGEIRARISAPPRLFFVDTASGTAVDLGCEYSLSSDEEGAGLLQVSKGWVSFEWKELESLIPAGASCRTMPQAGPGIPYFDDARAKLRQAADLFGFEKASTGSLDIILSESRVRDTLTLWHLLSRVDLNERGRVFDRIAALTPIPAGVSRDQALRLDPETLKRLREELAWTW
jgi:hypothetical protein